MQPEDDSTVPDPAAEGDIAHQLADLREELHVAGLKAKAITAEYGRKIKFTIREAAFLCECSEGTIKNAIATGERTWSNGMAATPYSSTSGRLSSF
jgi:hypothetical protein